MRLNFVVPAVLDTEGPNELRLTDKPGFDSAPRWSPDGRRIAFHGRREGFLDILAMDRDGENMINATRDAAEDYYHDWSPDGGAGGGRRAV